MTMRTKILVLTSVAAIAVLTVPSMSGRNEPLNHATAAVVKASPAAEVDKEVHQGGVATTDPLAAARTAKAKGELELAEHDCVALIRKRTAVPEAMATLVEVRNERVANIIATVDASDRRSLQTTFDRARDIWLATEGEAVPLIQADLEASQLSEVERAAIYKLIRDIQRYSQSLAERRTEAFKTFAWQHINKAKEHYAWGKRSWYWVDDDSRFIEGLIELNYATNILDELSDGDRAVIAEWHNRLKGELNKAKYEQAMERSRITLGTK